MSKSDKLTMRRTFDLRKGRGMNVESIIDKCLFLLFILLTLYLNYLSVQFYYSIIDINSQELNKLYLILADIKAKPPERNKSNRRLFLLVSEISFYSAMISQSVLNMYCWKCGVSST